MCVYTDATVLGDVFYISMGFWTYLTFRIIFLNE